MKPLSLTISHLVKAYFIGWVCCKGEKRFSPVYKTNFTLIYYYFTPYFKENVEPYEKLRIPWQLWNSEIMVHEKEASLTDYRMRQWSNYTIIKKSIHVQKYTIIKKLCLGNLSAKW